VQAGLTYAYEVVARDAAGNLSPASSRVIVTTPQPPPPTVPGPPAVAPVPPSPASVGAPPPPVAAPGPLPLVAASARALAPVATMLPGARQVGRAVARRAGLVVRFRAPPGARRATIDVFRTKAGVHTVLESRRFAVRAGVNRISLGSRSLRRRLRPGLHLIAVTLRTADGRAGGRATLFVRVVRRV
jgi:hypothetical protein